MNTVFGSRKRLCLTGAAIFLLVAGLIPAMVGCTAQAEYTPMVAASYHVVGLESDGTVVAAGHNWWGECDVRTWSGITQVAAGGYHTVALKYDGTVVSAGLPYQGQRIGVNNWTDILHVAAGGYHSLALKADGTVVGIRKSSS